MDAVFDHTYSSILGKLHSHSFPTHLTAPSPYAWTMVSEKQHNYTAPWCDCTLLSHTIWKPDKPVNGGKMMRYKKRERERKNSANTKGKTQGKEKIREEKNEREEEGWKEGFKNKVKWLENINKTFCRCLLYKEQAEGAFYTSDTGLFISSFWCLPSSFPLRLCSSPLPSGII